jgi:hypothetical protein
VHLVGSYYANACVSNHGVSTGKPEFYFESTQVGFVLGEV